MDHTHHGHVQPRAGFLPAPLPPNWAALVDAALCFLSCALGVVSGLVIGVLLGWSTTATIALGIPVAFVYCFALTECPVLRRGTLYLKQFG